MGSRLRNPGALYSSPREANASRRHPIRPEPFAAPGGGGILLRMASKGRARRTFSCTLVALVVAAPGCAGDITGPPIGDLKAVLLTDRGVTPDISGDFVVWLEPSRTERGIKLLDLKTGTQRPLSSGVRDVQLPAISGDKVVWILSDHERAESEEGFFRGDVVLADIASGQEVHLTDTPDMREQFPDISGDRAVWEVLRLVDVDGTERLSIQIFLLDLATGEGRQISSGPGAHQQPAISGDRIVWQLFHPPISEADGSDMLMSDMLMFDLSTGETTPLVVGGLQGSADISGDRVVWVESKGRGISDIILLDLSTGDLTRVTDDANGQGWPRISGNRIVWEDDRNGNIDIFMFDISTGVETQITGDPSDQVEPRISGDKVIWRDQGNNPFEIFLLDLAK